MIDVNSTYEICQYIINKETNGNFSPNQLNTMLPTAESDFFRSIARPQADQFHNWSVLKAAEDDMRLHTLKVTTNLTFTSGLTNIPTDFRDWLAFALNVSVDDGCGNKIDSEFPVEVVEEDEWATRLSSSVDNPTLRYPIIKFNATQLQIAPTTATPMRFTYYKIPAKPKWVNIEPVTNDTPVYDPTASTQSEFPEICQISIINILLKKIGINLDDQAIQMYADQAKAQV